VDSVGPEEGGQCEVNVTVDGVAFRFRLKVKDIGCKKGCWMTAMLQRDAPTQQ